MLENSRRDRDKVESLAPRAPPRSLSFPSGQETQERPGDLTLEQGQHAEPDAPIVRTRRRKARKVVARVRRR